ncbi:hypothetical protein [Mesorhizobium huakuii]|uniref:DUF2384 domain-containing protein n=1 Tax=Mesorhizobium huakuii TaxID=28104 RepID=A0A7G6T122_9HYPH|nr:hypothetical protein [Mesorhizobium huakuii]QND60454.1 hypothetical protein HB778_30830 [Mesorhizobium huakuii]
MNKSFSFGDEPQHRDLSSLVAEEVQRVLTLCDQVIKERGSTSSIAGAGNVAPAGQPSTPCRQGVHEELTALAIEFIRKLADGAARSFDANAPDAAPPTARTDSAHEFAVLRARDQQCDSMRIADWAGQVAGSTYLEEHFGIPRSTLNWWQRHNDVVGLRKGSRKHVFPLAQFIDGRPVPGIRQVLSLFSSSRLAWLWLVSPLPRPDGRIPIEMLRQDLAAEVILAAQNFLHMKPS